MNPMLQAALGSIIRALLASVGGFFVQRGWWTQGEATEYIAGLTLVLISLLWSLWEKYGARIKFLTALESPRGATEAGVNAKIAIGQGAKILPLILLMLLAGGAWGCAGRLTPLQVVQVSHGSLASAQDLEAGLCWGVPSALDGPADKSHCTAPIASTIGLTDVRHQAINGKLATAFRLHQHLTAQIDAGLSVDLASLQAIITDILALVADLQQTPQVAQLVIAVKAGGVK